MLTLLLLTLLILVALASAAAADPLSDLLSDVFGGASSSPTPGKVRRAPRVVEGGASALLDVASRYVGRGNFTGFRGPWCGAAMSVVASEATGRRYWILRARDWAHVGRPTTAHVGAVAVLPDHVGTAAGFEGGSVLLAGGNQGGRFGVDRFPLSRVLAFREID